MIQDKGFMQTRESRRRRVNEALGDAADPATRLRRLIDEPERRARIAARPERVLSIEQTAARHLAPYESLRAARSGRG